MNYKICPREAQNYNVVRLLKKIFVKIEKFRDEDEDRSQGNGDALIFHDNDGFKYIMYYENDEGSDGIFIDYITGDLNDLIGVPILRSAVETEIPFQKEFYQVCTSYILGTSKGSSRIVWCGESNVFYSLEVLFKEIAEEYVRVKEDLLAAGMTLTVYE